VALTLESLLVTLAALVIAVLAMMLVARLMLGTSQATTRITTGRYLLTGVVALVVLFVVGLIGWPRGFDSLGTVAALLGLIYTIKVVLLPDTAPAEQWPRSLWMAVITYVVFLSVNLAANALFGIPPFSL
jgi:hypothetical protein